MTAKIVIFLAGLFVGFFVASVVVNETARRMDNERAAAAMTRVPLAVDKHGSIIMQK
jgi:hypothetical protein